MSRRRSLVVLLHRVRSEAYNARGEQTSAAVASRITDPVKAGLRQCRTSVHASLDTC